MVNQPFKPCCLFLDIKEEEGGDFTTVAFHLVYPLPEQLMEAAHTCVSAAGTCQHLEAGRFIQRSQDLCWPWTRHWPPSAPWPLTSLRKRAAWVLNFLTLALSPPPSLSSLGQAERPISLISPPPPSSCSSLIMGFASAVCYNKRAREDMKGGEALRERGESRGHRRGNLPSVSSCPPSLGCFINSPIHSSSSFIFPGDITVLNGLQSVRLKHVSGVSSVRESVSCSVILSLWQILKNPKRSYWEPEVSLFINVLLSAVLMMNLSNVFLEVLHLKHSSSRFQRVLSDSPVQQFSCCSPKLFCEEVKRVKVRIKVCKCQWTDSYN